MDDKAIIYWNLCNRHLDTRRTIVFAALTIVTTFGVWVIQYWIGGNKIVDWNLEEKSYLFSGEVRDYWVKFFGLTISFAFCWGIYFYSIFSIELLIQNCFEKLSKLVKFDDSELMNVRTNFNLRAKWFPALIGFITYILIILPL